MKILYAMLLSLVLVGCEQHKPVESLTFEEKGQIVKACQANGKIATDHYCMEVGSVYSRELAKKMRDEVVRKSQSDNSVPADKF